MGTRGLAGFRLKGKDYLFYNHFDSYPDGLGKDFFDFLNTIMNEDRIISMLTNAEIVENAEETKGIIHCFDDFAEAYVYYKGERLKFHLKNGFIKDSLFCEWAYIYDMDTKELEIYTGFNVIKALQPERYAIEYNEFSPYYYACKLLMKVPRDSFDKGQFLKGITENAQHLYVIDDKMDKQKCLQAVVNFLVYAVKSCEESDTEYIVIRMPRKETEPVNLETYIYNENESMLYKKLVIKNSPNCKKAIELVGKIFKAIKDKKSIVITQDSDAYELKPRIVRIKR